MPVMTNRTPLRPMGLDQDWVHVCGAFSIGFGLPFKAAIASGHVTLNTSNLIVKMPDLGMVYTMRDLVHAEQRASLGVMFASDIDAKIAHDGNGQVHVELGDDGTQVRHSKPSQISPLSSPFVYIRLIRTLHQR